MPRVTALNVYPLKSAGGVSLPTAQLTHSGLAHDRGWMVVDYEMNFVTQREQPRLALLRPRLDDDALALAAPGFGEVSIPSGAGAPVTCTLFGESCRALTTSSAADEWISDYLGMSASIVARDYSFHRAGGVQYPARDANPTSFVDNYGILIMSQASLADLNTRLEHQVPMQRFRPNIVVDGLPAYGEEDAQHFSTAEISLRFVNVCTRCVMTNVDQETAEVGREPFKTLSSFRLDKHLNGVRFGSYVVVGRGAGATLRLGDLLDIAA